MKEIKDDASAAMFENDYNIWWVTGGYNNDEKALKSTEFFSVEKNAFDVSFDLPKNVDFHNMVNVNNTHMIVLGGQIETDEVFIIDR